MTQKFTYPLATCPYCKDKYEKTYERRVTCGKKECVRAYQKELQRKYKEM